MKKKPEFKVVSPCEHVGDQLEGLEKPYYGESYREDEDDNYHYDSHYKKMVKLGYIGIYGILIFMAISGLMIHFYEPLGLTKDVAHDIKEIHELVFNAILIFVPLHIIGVLMAENKNEKGILSDMVNGGEKSL